MLLIRSYCVGKAQAQLLEMNIVRTQKNETNRIKTKNWKQFELPVDD